MGKFGEITASFFSLFLLCSVPLPPTDTTVTSFDKEHITFQWKPPANSAAVMYSVKISSSFWGHSLSDTVDNKTSYTFGGLKSGTRYKFEVRTVVDGKSSAPANVSHSTGETLRPML